MFRGNLSENPEVRVSNNNNGRLQHKDRERRALKESGRNMFST
jgi:hypothetical protein